MAATPEDDDPTHALDDFVRRMRQPAAAPDPAPDLSGLTARLHGGPAPGGAPPDTHAAPGHKPRGGMLRSGQRWTADDVEDVPVIDLPRTAPGDSRPPSVTLPVVDLQAEAAQAVQAPAVSLPEVQDAAPPDGAALQASVQAASDFVAGQHSRDAQAASQPVWQPDPVALQLRPAAHPRLPPQWQAGAWLGAVREVFGSSTEFVRTPTGTAVETYAAHRLLLLWRPQADPRPPGRWPQMAWLLTGPAAQERPAALSVVPGDAPLWLLADTADIDWALGAELVLHHQAGLRPFQVDGLRAFVAAEREAVFARINSGYGQPLPAGPVVRG